MFHVKILSSGPVLLQHKLYLATNHNNVSILQAFAMFWYILIVLSTSQSIISPLFLYLKACTMVQMPSVVDVQRQVLTFTLYDFSLFLMTKVSVFLISSEIMILEGKILHQCTISAKI